VKFGLNYSCKKSEIEKKNLILDKPGNKIQSILNPKYQSNDIKIRSNHFSVTLKFKNFLKNFKNFQINVGFCFIVSQRIS
jgi:lipopolysaccharide assembly outer membrane protein LptD (OstA)